MVEGQGTPQTLRATDHTDAVGRPRYAITEAHIRMMREEGFRWADIARYFGLSHITLRRRGECDMPVSENFDHISDDELDTLVAGVLHATPQAGLNIGSLELQELVVLDYSGNSMIRVDPITSTIRHSRRVVRRAYNITCPNALW